MLKKALLLGFASLMMLSIWSFTTTIDNCLSINLEDSVIVWKGYKVTGSHEGTLKLKSGDFSFEGKRLVGGKFEIDMNTLACTDLTDNMKTNLEGHLKSKDFFGVDLHPTAAFVITKVVSRGTPGDYKIIGNLTIKGITKEIKFNAKIDGKEAKADITIDRTDYDLRYSSGSFFDNLGDKTIYDEFDLNIKIVLN